jgi:ribosome maturation factor RimP
VNQEEVINKIKRLVTPILDGEEIELVDLIFRREGKRMVLRLLVDKPQGGISLDNLAKLNQTISQLLDETPIFQESYILEVSSPGLNRPLKLKRDFQRAVGKKVFVITSESIEGKKDFVGELKVVEEENIILKLEGREIKIPLEKIIKARQVI